MAEQNNIKTMLDSSAGKALKKLLLGYLYELQDIENLKEIDTPTHQAIELKAQRRAYLKLREIFNEIMTVGTDARSKDPRDDYYVE